MGVCYKRKSQTFVQWLINMNAKDSINVGLLLFARIDMSLSSLYPRPIDTCSVA